LIIEAATFLNGVSLTDFSGWGKPPLTFNLDRMAQSGIAPSTPMR